MNGNAFLHQSRPGVRFQHWDDRTLDGKRSLLDSALNVFTGLLAVCCLAGFMTVLVVLYVTVRPFSNATYRRLAAGWGGVAFLDAMTVLLPCTRIHLTGDSDVPCSVSSSVMVCNHVCEADWWAIFLLGRCVGLRNQKVFLRNEFLHINMENVELSAITASSNIHHTINTTTSSNSNSNGHGNQNPSSTLNSTATPASSAANTPLTSNSGGVSFATASKSSTATSPHRRASPDLTILAKLLYMLMDFPLLNGETADNNREQLFSLLRSFATENNESPQPPVHLLLYPEGWSIHNGADRASVHQKSNQFAKREGKPTLKHLLLPRTRGFNASLECLREASPVIYDVTMAYAGYDGSLPHKVELSMPTLWDLLRRKFPHDVHLRIKRYSMDEVYQDSNWLFKKWAEKDRLLSHFARHQDFPSGDSIRSNSRDRVFDTRHFNFETSIISLLRLLVLPCAVPCLLLLSFPLFWMLLVLWSGQRLFWMMSPNSNTNSDPSHAGQRTPGSTSAEGTPYLPATPFASPSIMNWRDTFESNSE